MTLLRHLACLCGSPGRPCTKTPQGAVQFAAGYHNGAVQAMRLIEEKSQYAPDEELTAMRAAVVEKILAVRPLFPLAVLRLPGC